MFTRQHIVELYRAAATDTPRDVERAIADALTNEREANAKDLLKVILENIALARAQRRPLCQDTGTPIFYVERPAAWSEREVRKVILAGTKDATKQIPLRPNAVEPFSGRELGNAPLIHVAEAAKPRIRLLLKGGGSENISQVYSLPDGALKAQRDLEGVRRCVLDAVVKAQGKGCPPYIVCVAIGGSVEEVAHLAKRQLLRSLVDKNPNKSYARFERSLLADINRLGIGPMGLGGTTTALALKFAAAPRHPATFFVCVSFGCWATRRAQL